MVKELGKVLNCPLRVSHDGEMVFATYFNWIRCLCPKPRTDNMDELKSLPLCLFGFSYLLLSFYLALYR